MNKQKGFILSTYVYIVLAFFLLILGTILIVLNNTKVLSKKMKEEASETSETNIHLILNGDKNMKILIGTEYIDPGYIATTNNGKDLSTSVKTQSNLDVSKLGTYSIIYKISYNSESVIKERKVEVVSTYDFLYTGNYQLFTVPADGYYEIELWGASGADSLSSDENSTIYFGGNGAYTDGKILLAKDDKLYIYVGGTGKKCLLYNVACAGGYNGGGDSFSHNGDPISRAGGGGGATDIRFSNRSLNDRIMVAAGGGGSNYTNGVNYGSGGNGGGLIGQKPIDLGVDNLLSENILRRSNGGTQISGGKTDQGDIDLYSGGFGNGGTIDNTNGSTFGSGGGGGYYGGSSASIGPGAGGSSYISGYAGVNSITSSSDLTHTNNTKHYNYGDRSIYFFAGKIVAGSNKGNGMAKITYLGNSEPERKNTQFESVRYIKDCIENRSDTSINNKNWIEIQAIAQGVNVALGKTITHTSDSSNFTNSLNGSDGKIDTEVTDNISGSQCIIVDLGSAIKLDEIMVSHHQELTFNDNDIFVSTDNSNWTTLVENQNYVYEGSDGKRYNAWDEIKEQSNEISTGETSICYCRKKNTCPLTSIEITESQTCTSATCGGDDYVAYTHPYCNVAHCQSCYYNNPCKCYKCNSGYVLTSGTCVLPSTYNPSTGNSQIQNPNCFLKGTKILTIDGYKDIDKIMIGDKVLSYNEISNKNEYNTVLKTYIHEDKTDILYFVTINKKIIKVTGGHPFYVRKRSGYAWIKAKNLKIGDQIRNSNGKYYSITGINYETVTTDFYNIEVSNNHNYYVTSDNILVHNKY